jgi:hypothetical protein
MKSESCIFCNSKDNLTNEHIIPETISKKNNHLVIPFVCKDCNNKLGAYVDGPFINDTMINLHRILYDLKGKKNRIPPIKFKSNSNSIILKYDLSIIENGKNSESKYREANSKRKASFIKAYISNANKGIRLLVEPMTEILVDYKIDSERFKLFALKVAYEVVLKNLGEHIDKNEKIFIKIQNILMQAIGGEFNEKIPELKVVGPLFNEFSCLVGLSDLLQKHIVYTVITKNRQVIVNICLFGLKALAFSIIALEHYKGVNGEYIDLVSYGDSPLP